MAAVVDLPTAEGPMTVRVGDGALESTPLPVKTVTPPGGVDPATASTPAAPPAAAPKHDSEEVDPQAADMEKKAGDMRDLLGEEPQGNLVEGIEDDVLYTLMRGFDKQINHVLHPAADLPPHEPDLRMTNLPNVAFRSDTLKSNFERVFSTAGPHVIRGAGELVRLTDWETLPRRTGTYCAVYFIAWFFGYALVLLGAFATVLACFPGTRRYLFPRMPAPGKSVSATDPTNQAGDESLIGTDRQRSQAEQTEQQAFEARAIFEAYVQTVFLGHGGKAKSTNSKVGEKTTTMEEESDSGVVLDDAGEPIARKEEALDAADAVEPHAEVVGGTKLVAEDKRKAEKAARLEAKRKRDEMVAKMAKGTETGLGGVADLIEILQNTMSPPPPYPETYARFKFAAVAFVIPVLALHIIPARVFGRAASFGLGAALWGRPVIRWLILFIPRITPNLRILLDPRNSLLSRAPTNAQLMLYLYRAAEYLGDPLPPPPEAPVNQAQKKALEDTAPSTTEAGSDDLAQAKRKEESGKKLEAAGHRTRATAKRQIARVFRKMGKKVAGWHGDVAVDGKEKPIAGNFKSGLLYRKFGTSPDAYACKLDGKAGHLLIDAEAGRIAWVALTESAPAPEYTWEADKIVELQKASVSIPRVVAGFVGGVSIVSLGLVMRFDGPLVPEGEENPNIVELSSVERRDPLFNRLIAIGPQRWEIL